MKLDARENESGNGFAHLKSLAAVEFANLLLCLHFKFRMKKRMVSAKINKCIFIY